MILGILSDTHGQTERAARALALLERLEADCFVHCGDVGSEAIFELLAERNQPLKKETPEAEPTPRSRLAALLGQGEPVERQRHAWFVWGNTDHVTPQLERYVASLGLSLPTSVPLRIDTDGRVILVAHGHEAAFVRLQHLLRAGDEPLPEAWRDVDYVLYGHSHVAASQRLGRARFINPGALHRAATYSVATLDLETHDVHFWRVDDKADEKARPRRYYPH